MEELKIIVSERLNSVTSEILSAITKAVRSYEREVSRLKEENDRHRSVLDIILKTKSSKTKASASNPPTDSEVTQETGQTDTSSVALPTVFTSRDEVLKLASNGNCPFCFKKVQATSQHLHKRHYRPAVHFTLDGCKKFVIPCKCKEKIQNRSHWHCPLCSKIIYRRCSFEDHLSKQHKLILIQQDQDAEKNLPPVLKANIPSVPEPWCQQEISSLEQQENRALQFLRTKNEPEQETHLQAENDQQELKDNVNAQMKKQSIDLNPNQDSGLNITCIDAYIQDISEISFRNPPPAFSAQAVDTELETRVTGLSEPAEGNQLTTEMGSSSMAEKLNATQITSSLNQLGPKNKEAVKRSLPSVNVYAKKGRQFPAHQNASASFRCKACGKNFHYMYTLKTHVRTHARDKTCVCGICGKRLEGERFFQHVQSHNQRNVCGKCGKEFSSNSRLKRHKRFHLPKGLNG